MIWIVIFGTLAVAGAVALVVYAVGLAHKAADVRHEIEVEILLSRIVQDRPLRHDQPLRASGRQPDRQTGPLRSCRSPGAVTSQNQPLRRAAPQLLAQFSSAQAPLDGHEASRARLANRPGLHVPSNHNVRG